MQTIQVAAKPDKKEIWLGMSYTQAAFLLGIVEVARLKETMPERKKLAGMICNALDIGFESAIEHTDGFEHERN